MGGGESYPMSGGDGPNSYAKNSCYQKEVVNDAKSFINDAISTKFDMDFTFISCLNIVDFGCSVGPNTFIAMQNIIQAIENKYQTLGEYPTEKTLEFQVFFNDHTENDFNTLFKTLPSDRNYFTAGVPGSFYGRLFPKASLHIGFSSSAMQWLSRVPPDVVDKESLAWNKGSVLYCENPRVFEAYSAQYKKDIAGFLSARAQEMVGGGLLLLVLPGQPDDLLPSDSTFCKLFGLIGPCLMDMANMGIISEERVDSFNIPMYSTSPSEWRNLVETNGYFSIERLEICNPPLYEDLPDFHMFAMMVRVGLEGLVTQHFGCGIVDDLFDRFEKKLIENASDFHTTKVTGAGGMIFTCLKRK